MIRRGHYTYSSVHNYNCKANTFIQKYITDFISYHFITLERKYLFFIFKNIL